MVDWSTGGEGPVLGRPDYNFVFAGNQKGHLYETSESWRAKADITRQFGVIHEAKAGIDFQFHSLDRQVFTILYDGDECDVVHVREEIREDVEETAEELESVIDSRREHRSETHRARVADIVDRLEE